MKSGGSDDGGYLLYGSYQAYAAYLAAFVQTMANTYGVNLVAVSVQNEPELAEPYDSCIYSPTELDSFIGSYLGPAFAGNGIAAKIMLPEPWTWSDLSSYADTTLNDANATTYVGIVASHGYGGSPFWYANAKNQGKEVWETEVSDFGAWDPGIDSGLNYAQQIHNCLTVAEVNAWHYWRLIDTSSETDNEGLISNSGAAPKRLYSLGNWSKFVRPGYYMIGATNNPDSGIDLTAFKNPGTGDFVIVVINNNTSPYDLGVTFNGFSASTVTPWETSASLNLAQQTAITCSSSGFSASLDGQSVTTFVGTASVVTGLVAGAVALPPKAVNLSAEGSGDWAHWGLKKASDFDHCAGVVQQISNYTLIGGGRVKRYAATGSPRYAWIGGTPVLKVKRTHSGIRVSGKNNGFQITVPAETTARTLKLYVGVSWARGKLTAALSDGSAPVYEDTSVKKLHSTAHRVYTLRFGAASPGVVLTVTWTCAEGGGGVLLQAADVSE